MHLNLQGFLYLVAAIIFAVIVVALAMESSRDWKRALAFLAWCLIALAFFVSVAT